MTDVLLLRHAQSTWNADGRWQGRSDPPLSAFGIDETIAAAEAEAAAIEAKAAAAKTTGHEQARPLDDIAAVVSSDLSRARQTAEILAARLGWGRVELYPGLRERDVGEFTGLTRHEIEARWPGLLGQVPLNPPGAEALASLLSRAVATLHRVALSHSEGRVVAVTHGALIRTVEAHLGVGEPGPPRNLTGRWVRVEGGQLSAGPRAALRPSPGPTAAPAVPATSATSATPVAG